MTTRIPDSARVNEHGPTPQAWADRLVAELLAAGIGGFVLSPGSRNTPLSLALARGCPDRTVIHQEERGAAFFALGASRAGNRPWGVVCTSGSAVANWMPAVVEASASRTPLILLSADRPEFLHHQRANQTMEQTGLFGPFARCSWNLSPPASAQELEQKIRLIHTAFAVASGRHPGPAHLNLPFDEPLISGELPDFVPAPTPAVRWHPGIPAADANTLRAAQEFIRGGRHGLLVVGGMRCAAAIHAVRSLATRLGWPVYADITSGLRMESLDGLAIAYADLLPDYWAERLKTPDRILWIGDSLVQRAFPAWLARTGGDCMLITDHDEGQDPYGMVRTRIVTDLSAFCKALTEECQNPLASPASFRQEQTLLDHAIDTFAETEGHSLDHLEPIVARWILDIAARHQTPVFLGNSMPVRWGGLYGKYDGGNTKVFASRGVSGIDGAVATATGLSEGMNRRPVLALLGDLTLFHDLSSLALAAQRKLPLVIVVLNNRGGRIFHHLPQARHCPELLTPWFTAGPITENFRSAAELFRWNYACPVSRDTLLSLLEAALTTAEQGPTLIELKLDGEMSRATHEQLKQRCEALLTENAGTSGRNLT